MLHEKMTYLNDLMIFFKSTEEVESLVEIKVKFTYSLICKLKLTLSSPTLQKIKKPIYAFIEQNALNFLEKILKPQGLFNFSYERNILQALYIAKEVKPEFLESYVTAFNESGANKDGQFLGTLMLFSF